MRRFPRIAPELLYGHTGDTQATETYALGYMLRELGLVFEIERLERLGETCQSHRPDHRLTLDMVKIAMWGTKRNEVKENLFANYWK